MVILKEAEKHAVVHKSFSGNVYAIIRSSYSRMLISGGLSLDSDSSDILLQSRKSFEMMDGILKAEDFEFSDVIRQWNYIEDITGYVVKDNRKSQHYQIFNDIRSMFYRKSDFLTGYPAGA